MIAVLCTASGVLSRRLQMPVRVRADPHVPPRGRDRQGTNPREGLRVAQARAVRKYVAEALAAPDTPDPRPVAVDVAELRAPSRAMGVGKQDGRAVRLSAHVTERNSKSGAEIQSDSGAFRAGRPRAAFSWLARLARYGFVLKPGDYIRDLLSSEPGRRVTARGWIKTRRDGKGVHFLQLNDGSGFRDLQVVIAAGAVSDGELAQATTGACVEVDGELSASPAAGQRVELQATVLRVLGAADPKSYPLQKKGHSFEFLRDIAHLRPRSNTFGAVFRVRSALSFAIHQFFRERGFLYVHTPIITASDCEGGGAMFGVTTLDLMNVPRTPEGGVDHEKDFFGKPAYLTVSGQLEGEIFALALSNIYTFGPTFRAENSNTPRHLAEFWMIEPEMAFCDLAGDMELAEDFLKYVIRYVLDHCQDDLEFFNQRIDDTVLKTLEHVATSAFEHVTYTEAVSILEKAGRTWEFPVHWGADLQSEHERYLTEEKFGRPVIVTDYPKAIKAFYMRENDDGKTVRAMDVLAPRIGEIIGGSQREERIDLLRERIREHKLDEKAYWWYLELRKYGSAPHSGFGLGLERMLMYLTGMKNIRDVVPFARTPGSADF
jgi:asparaginyl-tRNA synthetase